MPHLSHIFEADAFVFVMEKHENLFWGSPAENYVTDAME
jgi:hypothetical protein